MRLLSNDDFTIRLGKESICLRPSLGAASRLEQKYGGFHTLFEAVRSGSLTAFSDVLKEGSGKTSTLTDYLDVADDNALAVSLDLLIPEVINFLLALSGADGANAVAVGEPIPYVDYHLKLYRIATGWLSWPPDVAWNATPAEIIEAQNGLIEKLHLIHGGKTEPTDAKPGADTRRRLSALGDLNVTTMDQVRS